MIVFRLALMVAGTKYRGSLKKEQGSDGGDKTFTGRHHFIDELAYARRAGRAEGAIDASNILKPGFPAGDAVHRRTNMDEYRKYIEKEAALERDFRLSWSSLLRCQTVDHLKRLNAISTRRITA